MIVWVEDNLDILIELSSDIPFFTFKIKIL